MSTTIRVSERTRERFAQLSAATGRPMTELLDDAADALERRVFFDHLAARYAELRRDGPAWPPSTGAGAPTPRRSSSTPGAGA